MTGYGPDDPGRARHHRSAESTAATVRATARVTGGAAPDPRRAEPEPARRWWQDPARLPLRPPAGGDGARRYDTPDNSRWLWLLLIPALLPLFTTVYNRVEPRLAGIPFFYWFQLALVGLEIAVITLVYQATKIQATKRLAPKRQVRP
jgi:Protein of unknown function (DUF3311)